MGWFTRRNPFRRNPFTREPSVSASDFNVYDKLVDKYINGFGGNKDYRLPYSYELKSGTKFLISGQFIPDEKTDTSPKNYDIYYGQEIGKKSGTITTLKEQTIKIPESAYKIKKDKPMSFILIPSTYKIREITYEGNRTILELLDVAVEVNENGYQYNLYPQPPLELYGGRRKRLTKRRKALRHRRRRRTIRA
jgi:hypothetical protein